MANAAQSSILIYDAQLCLPLQLYCATYLDKIIIASGGPKQNKSITSSSIYWMPYEKFGEGGAERISSHDG